MHEAIYSFLELPIAARCTIFLFIVLVLYWIFGRLILKVLSLMLWVLNKLIYGLYYLLEIPVSALHRSMGGVFKELDQRLTNGAEWCCTHTENLRFKTRKPKTIFPGRALLVFLALGAYLLIPMYFEFSEQIFTFWQTSYLICEARIIDFILR